MSVTIRDVAKAAGVSPSTVSRAFSQPEIVDAATLERVRRVAEHLHYRPNRAARGLITGRTGNVGLLLPDLANPFFPLIVKAIQHQAHVHDYQVFVVDTDEDPSVELGLARSLAKQVDGIILCSPRMRPTELRESAEIAPTVLLNRLTGNLPAVSFDNVDAMRQIIDHLAGLGHQRIGYVAGPRNSWSSRQRINGLRTATAARGIALEEMGTFAPTFEGGIAATQGVIVSGVTAVVAYNDLVAFGLLTALRDHGIDVPGQLSIVGVDDIPMSAMVQPALTTVAIPKQALGRASIDLLLQLLEQPATRTPPVQLLTGELVVRETTAPPASAPAARPASPATGVASTPRRRQRA